ncbi:hypothetical protein [Cochleicola gelatinilyticus]|uniref:Uncharacterized protein n=1 Tax=Cochleicola gelatinilyticus TaxID=1763537 RepID=A0A167EZU7_9FLAO|nr:hypothetical protein [Cochleicola gelatinilyticus]OAB76048.1 hypothetical protein ULVI_13380 [Cochleicola gelatinilyticus]
MEPIKFEDHLREKLEEREIQPSKDAWSKLEAQLGEEKKSNIKGYWWAIAAGFIGILIVSTVFFTKDASGINNNSVVETNPSETNNTIDKVENKTEIVSEVNKNNKVETETITTEKVQEVKATVRSQQRYATHNRKEKTEAAPTETKPFVQNQSAAKSSIASVTEQHIESGKQESKETNNTLFIKNKVSQVVAQVQQLQENNTMVTAEEIDVLLASAQREIATQRILRQPKVDAAALLEDVEMELEQNFRERVFEALGEGFQKIRTAVVDRNQ